jgi:hypothetical protein
MSTVIKKTLFVFLFIISLSFQNSITQIHVPHAKTQRVIEPQSVSKDLGRKTVLATDDLLQFTAGGHVLGFRKGDMFIASGDHALRIEFINSQPVAPLNEEISSSMESSRQVTESLGRVSYSNLWDGVTLVYERHNDGAVKSSYIIKPGGSGVSSPIGRIRLRYNVSVEVDSGGNLVLSFETGRLIESRPVAWQEIKGERVPVDVSFRSLGDREVGFKVGPYDPQFPLVIDPVLSWHTYMGSSGDDVGNAIALDTNGNIYLAGWSDATWGSPILPHSGGQDNFVAKLNSSGELQWNTFLGPSGQLLDDAVAVDDSGYVYVVGTSTFPGGDWGHFVAKLNSNGELQWRRFGAETYDGVATAVAVDAIGNIYVGGWGGCWLAPGVHVGSGAWVAKLGSGGADVWNACLGCFHGDEGALADALAVDASGNVYVTGRSNVSWGPPINPYAGGLDAFVAKLNSNGILQWNTFMGSSGSDGAWGIALDGSGNVYVSGSSEATWGTPVNAYAGETDAFAAKLNTDGVRLWNTFMGSAAGGESGWAVAVDSSGNVLVTGMGNETWGPPVYPPAGHPGAFVAKLNNGGARLWNTFMEACTGQGGALAVDASGSVYLGGSNDVPWGAPVNPFSGELGSPDGFVAKISAYDVQPFVFGGHDFDGSATSDISLYRPTNGMWYVRNGAPQQWGAPGDIPVQGYYDLNATTDMAVWRQYSGLWFIFGIATIQWGIVGDIPVPHDYDGNGVTDLAVWRLSNGVWYINGVGNFQWGQDGDYPVPGDYNGDGVDEVAVWRPANGEWFIYGGGYSQWGTQGDIPVPADYDGDGRTDVAVYRPSIGMWYIQYSGGGTAAVQWGTASDIPVPGDYDGNGSTDVAIWRSTNGLWYIYGGATTQYGTIGDIPLVK